MFTTWLLANWFWILLVYLIALGILWAVYGPRTKEGWQKLAAAGYGLTAGFAVFAVLLPIGVGILYVIVAIFDLQSGGMIAGLIVFVGLVAAVLGPVIAAYHAGCAVQRTMEEQMTDADTVIGTVFGTLSGTVIAVTVSSVVITVVIAALFVVAAFYAMMMLASYIIAGLIVSSLIGGND